MPIMLARGPDFSFGREDAAVDVRDPAEMFERVRALPAAKPLLARLDERPRTHLGEGAGVDLVGGAGVDLGEGAGVHLVGGAVRDLLLGGTPYDLDLAVEGDASAFAASLGGALKVHDRFGTSTVVLDGFAYDIGRTRRETYARPGALPDRLCRSSRPARGFARRCSPRPRHRGSPAWRNNAERCCPSRRSARREGS